MAPKPSLSESATWMQRNPGKTVIAAMLLISFAAMVGRAF